MTARTGMTTLIDTVRGMTNAGTSDYAVGTLTYWSDDEIQRVLDRHKIELRQHPMTSDHEYIGDGTIAYYNFWVGYKNLESGTLFKLQYSTGATVGTADYTLDSALGKVVFDSDTSGTAFMCDAFAYDINAAAADIWTMKGAYYATSYDFSTDNHSFSRSQILKQCESMAMMYSRLADSGFDNGGGADLYRSDT